MRRASSRAVARAGAACVAATAAKSVSRSFFIVANLSVQFFYERNWATEPDRSAWRIIATMLKPTCIFDRARAIGFRLVLAAALAPAGAHADWITGNEAIMGTRCAVELWSDDSVKGEAAITSVFDDMKRIDRLMSTWKEDTEISEVNRDAGKHPVKISEELFRLLQTSVKYSELTQGAFDITYASVGYLYDFRRHIHPDQAAIAAALPGI